ncbi:MAG: adenosylmethionine decarboxylase [Oligoflexales bacterium]
MVPGDEHLFHGVHILGEIYGVEASVLDDAKFLEKILKKGIEASGASLCGTQSKEFDPCGVTILALLSESHASIHTYPDRGSLFFDAFTCGDRCKPELIAKALIDALNPTRHTLSTIKRGEVPGQEQISVTSSSSETLENHVVVDSL